MKSLTQLKRAVTRLIKAEIANQWKGAGDPQYYDYIEGELKAAKKNYNDKLAAVEAEYIHRGQA